MEKKDFYKYAKGRNRAYKDETLEKMRDDKLKSASAKMIEIASYIKDNSGFPLAFEICLNKKFKNYEYNWASIRINNFNIYIFIVETQEQRDIIFQIYKRMNILIFNNDVDMDFVGSEIVRKIEMINAINNKKNGE